MIIGITDSSLFDTWESFKERVVTLLDSDLDYLILREKALNAEEMVSLLLEFMSATDNACRKIVVHSQVEAARHLGLTYVHLPESRVTEARRSHTKYSYSVHSVDGLKALEKGTLFTLIGPAFETACKPGCAPLTEEAMKEALSVFDENLVALGGVTVENAKSLKEIGFEHIALRSSLMTVENPLELIGLYKEMGF
ncbi:MULTISPECIES: thiamine phosphate synthase [unclassified Fusibacter]|uniref:thiamine phosphate synthase n=1 Tax=unclassified Fusibacter TaxID=2624464 RepID=UPI001011DC68|nr:MULTISPECIES: thiamine phosphate synthase [unclassified Fusibacter]MCK8059928.1 thiamine phosphate synthase [Fusibacter sp. A2]NPE22070.1 thiamine phosphate synthase [Fusibacter sp. A1]RXV60849.1 thiamine phosphate synthase [Fusibacter sp. A1]